MLDPTRVNLSEKKEKVQDESRRSIYGRKEATALQIIRALLQKEDRSVIGLYKTVQKGQAILKKKYTKSTPVTTQQYIVKIANFDTSKYDSIDTTQQDLKDLRIRLVSVAAYIEGMYSDEALQTVFITYLLATY